MTINISKADSGGVRIFEHADGYVTCWLCTMPGATAETSSYDTTDAEQMIAHLQEHRAAGQPVPAGLDQQLRDDWPAW